MEQCHFLKARRCFDFCSDWFVLWLVRKFRAIVWKLLIMFCKFFLKMQNFNASYRKTLPWKNATLWRQGTASTSAVTDLYFASGGNSTCTYRCDSRRHVANDLTWLSTPSGIIMSGVYRLSCWNDMQRNSTNWSGIWVVPWSLDRWEQQGRKLKGSMLD